MRAPPLLCASLLLGAAALVGCGDSSGTDVDELVSPAPSVLSWVNPARCLVDCTHPNPSGLVAIDANARRVTTGDLRIQAVAQPALAELLTAANAAGYAVTVDSAYRSYTRQAELYDMYLTTQPGRAARPGHSEHEAGLAADLHYDTDAAASWLIAHAWEHGFVQSYPDGKEKITGFRSEPWHYRYIGRDVSAAINGRGITSEEYFEGHPDEAVWGDCSDCTLDTSRSECGALTGQGTCDGDVLTWCMQGAATAVDCTASLRVCGWQDDTVGNSCLAQP